MEEMTSKLKRLFKPKPKAFKGQGQKLGSSGHASSSTGSASTRPSESSQQAYPQQQPAREKRSPPVTKRSLGLQSAPSTERSDVPPASVVTTGAYVAPEEEEATDAQQEAFALLSSAPRRSAAAEVLTKVLRNIVEHPTEAKYRKLKLNNKKVQEAVVNVDGGLELLQASGFELVFDESSPEPQAAAALAPGMSSQSQGSTSAGLAQSGSQSSSGLPFGDAWLKGTSDAEASGQGQMAPAMAESGSAASAPAESATTGYLWFPEEAELWLLQAALQLLRPLTPLPFSKPLSQTGGAASPSSAFQAQSHTTRNSSASPSAKQTIASPTHQSSTMSGQSTQSTSPARQASTTTAEPSSDGHRSPGGEPAAQPAASSSNAAAGAINLAEPRPRKTQVLLPEQTDAQVPDWVFQQSSVELKQAYMAARKRREMDSMLMTRAYRAKLAGGRTQKGTYIYAVIRVRLPEGFLLQGEFNAREPVTAIYEWVSDSLRDPGLTYELILPTRKPLVTSMGRVSDADLLPSVLLNLRFDTTSAHQQMPSLRQSLLQQME